MSSHVFRPNFDQWAQANMIGTGSNYEAAKIAWRQAFVNCAAEARRYAGHYPQSSDGQNTFILLAEWADRQAG